jgi:hypothetical protein
MPIAFAMAAAADRPFSLGEGLVALWAQSEATTHDHSHRHLPEIEAKCPECGLSVMDPASMCRHAPWERCTKLMLETRKGQGRRSKTLTTNESQDGMFQTTTV